MERIVYLNGEYVKESAATISVFDRGFLFADAVYEVTAVLKGKLIDHSGHLARLERSARELGIRLPVTGDELTKIQRTLIEKNGLVEGGVYLQLTRGSEGDRDFSYSEEIQPTLVLFTQARQLIESPKVKTGIEVISIDDIRWRRRDIKTTSLLPACMAKHAAHLAGAEDVWMIEEGFVTEGGSSNAYIVTKEGTLVTRPLSHNILHGITRASLMALVKEYSMLVEERFFTIEEAYAAQEAFISSATTFIWPVVAIDGKPIGEGKPGEISLILRDIYIKTALEFAQ
ncbi:D-amino-acid transaminase [Vibrio sp. V27_P1S3P104]|uniref:D-amino-acid transaminase n=1 Tax=Vibrio TaxID=662 RepID=UPI000C173995|nr:MULTISPECIES: D-amino-acid transaminase [Vibrio]NAW68665.1 D-amino-acid transaminase [Vibrio sp. V28_P6S34P95]NAX03573.1 D-amino-acid transaminase [Vibrio sp. V30_P3S12P165]NAX33722.1 D-amino-acid transaminase [Vibrio sp. V29_P1S30P107]NAX36665.1 D-amino-acid transaminase [Vibrio sp. V27_P1S3P104]NAX40525.1 D-amino-acid transaminase [Vibrio sp. V26_P1S5P106]